ncbi:MAG: hypothetical protein NC250_03095 [Alistipes senegalensis]|nr:hypothetical protein [Bacteroides cellulosilyticus]MCM1351704.1 hypothetical protein [Alistipes senegalensis]
MKTYLIIYAEETNNTEILIDRIKSLGDYCRFFNNHWFVRTSLNTAEDVYKSIIKDDLATISVIVLNISSQPSHNYWGFMNKAVWEWLKQPTE